MTAQKTRIPGFTSAPPPADHKLLYFAEKIGKAAGEIGLFLTAEECCEIAHDAMERRGYNQL